jgi:carboxymethylenebutenolidase
MRAQTPSYRRSLSVLAILALPFALASCAPADDGGDMDEAAAAFVPPVPSPPPAEEGALAALNSSPRHGEWVDIALPGSDTPVRTWAVYPERPDNAPVVIVTMEIFGLTDWIRSVADQFAAEGFIALAPDLLSGMGPDGGGTESLGGRDGAVAAVRTLEPEESMRRIDAVRAYALTIAAATDQIGIVGFCWGGGTSFAYAVHQSGLGASVVYYGTSPAEGPAYGQISAPVLGLYGGDDQRVNATIPTAQTAMTGLGKTYEVEVYDGAGHGFLRAQEGQEGANMAATDQAWPRTVNFFRQHLGS